MILIMRRRLSIAKEPEEDSFPEGYSYGSNRGTEEKPLYEVEYEEELHLPGTSARANNSAVFDLEEDGIIDDLRTLQKLGVRGSIHFANNCGPEYTCIVLTEEGVFTSTGVVKWKMGPNNITERE